MKNKMLVFLGAVLLIGFSVTAVSAQKPSSNKDNIPEKEGTYDVPGHSELQVHVHIYRAREQTNAILACTDPDSTAVDGKTGWHLPSAWTYNLNPQSAPASVGSASLPAIAANGFSAWSGAVSGKVVLNRGSDSNVTVAGLDNENIVAWGPVSSSNAIAVTYTWYYRATKTVAEVDTIMNNQLPWSWTSYASNICGAANTYDAQDILTHELGHWMGLNDKYSGNYANNTMYGYGSTGEIKKDTLATGDIKAVWAIYK